MHLNHAIANNRHKVLLSSSESSYFTDIDATSSFSSSCLYDKSIQIEYPWKDIVRPIHTFVGSCNGLLCFYIRNEYVRYFLRYDGIYLWNPSTREYKVICKPPAAPVEPMKVAYGFGYGRKIDDYKLIQFRSDPDNYTVYTGSEVHIYTLGSNSWRRFGDVPYKIHDISVPMTHLNGVIHWVGREVIVSFDIVEERIKEIQIPSSILGESYRNYIASLMTNRVADAKLGVLGEELCLSLEASPENFYLWVVKDSGSVEDSWTKLLSISKENPNWCSLRPLFRSFSNTNEILFEVTRSSRHFTFPIYHFGYEESYEKITLISYDSKKERFNFMPDVPKKLHSVITYVEILVL
ncbi:F-box/kelch-repeat protein At3g06240-like [Papaver somniferum]|uniref:F-box/kelch-repeat protein At3g06240-like n=1 Tax=Papaver somniferum TaxID=3469 RepID=UPI000E6FD104|nr:F-box/kelch-repeat protein At3g06240-like [Papaver somniferum]